MQSRFNRYLMLGSILRFYKLRIIFTERTDNISSMRVCASHRKYHRMFIHNRSLDKINRARDRIRFTAARTTLSPLRSAFALCSVGRRTRNASRGYRDSAGIKEDNKGEEETRLPCQKEMKTELSVTERRLHGSNSFRFAVQPLSVQRFPSIFPIPFPFLRVSSLSPSSRRNLLISRSRCSPAPRAAHEAPPGGIFSEKGREKTIKRKGKKKTWERNMTPADEGR